MCNSAVALGLDQTAYTLPPNAILLEKGFGRSFTSRLAKGLIVPWIYRQPKRQGFSSLRKKAKATERLPRDLHRPEDSSPTNRRTGVNSVQDSILETRFLKKRKLPHCCSKIYKETEHRRPTILKNGSYASRDINQIYQIPTQIPVISSVHSEMKLVFRRLGTQGLDEGRGIPS